MTGPARAAMGGVAALHRILRRVSPRWVRNGLDRAIVDLERFHPPRAAALPPGSRALLLAPHPDDESIACGGTLAHYVRRGVPVRVAFMTDGRQGDPELRRLAPRSPERLRREDALAARRQAEARSALAVLGITAFDFLAGPDGELDRAVAPAGAALARILDELRPDVVLLPFLTDRHPDHFATSRCFMAGLRQLGAGWAEDITCLGYEVWSPIYANLTIDISTCMDLKRRAIACHASQLAQDNYLAGVEGLNRFRAVSGLTGGEYAEAFFEAPLPLYRHLYERLAT